MNIFKKFLIEKWLKRHEWSIIDYPNKRGEYGYLYTVYSHPTISGTWDLANAIRLTKEKKL